MKHFFRTLFVLLLAQQSFAQHVYQIRADSVRIYNVCDTAELIIENRTRGVSGFLYNKGNGVTEFRRIQLESVGNGQIAIIGQDTLDLSTLPGIGGIDTIYRSGNNIIYVKKGVQHTINLPAPANTWQDVMTNGNTSSITPVVNPSSGEGLKILHDDGFISGYTGNGFVRNGFLRFSNSSLNLYTERNIPMYFGTGNVTRLTITENGGVGINTLSPRGGGLDVNLRNAVFGEIPTSIGYSSNGYPGIGYNVLHGATDDNDKRYIATSDNASYIKFQSGGFSFLTAPAGSAGSLIPFATRMVITEPGNVGIGITSPTYKLHVVGATYANGFLSDLNPGLAADLYANANIVAQSGSYPSIGFHKPGVWGSAIYGVSDFDFRIINSGGTTVNLWNGGNDGAGSGLDADLFDGISTENFVFGSNNTASVYINGGNLNTLNKSGFYNGSGMTGAPGTDWYNVIHSEYYSGNYANQIAQRFTGNDNKVNLFARTLYNGSWGDWQELWHSGNAPYPINRVAPFYGNGVSLSVDNLPGNTTTFAYQDAGSPTNGPIMSFGGFSGNSYDMQITGSYAQSAGRFYMRTKNGDNGTWNPWRELWHDGNFSPSSFAPVSGGANYIQNQTAATQNAGAWISGIFRTGNETVGSVRLSPADNTHSGLIEIINSNNNRLGYIGYANDRMQYYDDATAGHYFNGPWGTYRIGGNKGPSAFGGFKTYNYLGMVGDYDETGATRKIVWTIGDAWNSLSNYYGIGYDYTDAPGDLGFAHNMEISEAGLVGHRLYMNGNYSAGLNVETGGQIRAKGWYTNFGSGPALELGVSGGQAYAMGYDRTAGSYLTTNIQGNKISLASFGEATRTFNSNVGELNYGTWYVGGARNGWSGIALDAPNSPTLMWDQASPSNGGIYYQGNGVWALYYNGGTNNLHIGSSTGNIAWHTGNLTPSISPGGSTVVLRDGSGYIHNNYFESSDNSQTSGVSGIMVKAGDDYLRTGTAGAVLSFLNLRNTGSGATVYNGDGSFNRIRSSNGSISIANDGSGINLTVASSSGPTISLSNVTGNNGGVLLSRYYPISGCGGDNNIITSQNYPTGQQVITVNAIMGISTSALNNIVIGVIPQGYRPDFTITLSVPLNISQSLCAGGVQLSGSQSGTGTITVYIDPDGSIRYNKSGTITSSFSNGFTTYYVLPINITYAINPSI